MKPMNKKDVTCFNELYSKKRSLERKRRQLYKRMIAGEIERAEYFDRFSQLEKEYQELIAQLKELRKR